MPVITIECGDLTKEQKEQLISQMTETASNIMGIPKEAYIVTIKELPEENIGVGGKPLDQIKAGN